MPWASKEKRAAYQKKYNATEKAKKARAAANKARRMLMREGKVRKGDGIDVHHKRPLSKGGKTTRSNITPLSRAKNRGYKRGKPGQVK